MATERDYPRPAPELDQPTPRRRLRRLVGIATLVLISAIAGGIVGAAATIIVVNRLGHANSTSSLVPPLTNSRPTYEQTLTAVVKTDGASVVEIQTQPLSTPAAASVTTSALGSGFIVRSDGYIMTNDQVVEGATELRVFLRGQTTSYSAQLVGTSPADDIAVLRIDAQNLPALQFGNSDQLSIGQLAITLGRPTGSASAVSQGVISALHQTITLQDGASAGGRQTLFNAIQTDALLNPETNGGPLLDSDGHVIGVAVQGVQNADPQSTFAIDGNAAEAVEMQVLQTGHVNFPYMGASYVPVDVTTAATVGSSVGALIEDVTPASPAAKAGLRTGDIITGIGGQTVDDSHQLNDILRSYQPGDQITVALVRADHSLSVQVTLGTQP